LNNHRIELQRVDSLSEKLAAVTYQPKVFFVDEHPATNVVISLFTTSAARIKLLEAMEKIVRCHGCDILYTDT
jgi:hypothetical protein